MFACSVKVSYASDSATKAVLLKDKPARSAQEDSPTDPLQYIEVGKVMYSLSVMLPCNTYAMFDDRSWTLHGSFGKFYCNVSIIL